MSIHNGDSVSNDGKDDKKHNNEKDKKDSKIREVTAFFNIFILYLFSKPSNEDVRVDIINAVNRSGGLDDISRAKVGNPINPKEFNFDKDSCLDLIVTDEKGNSRNIEVQVSRQKFFMGRMVYYWSKIFTGQVEEGDGYNLLRSVNSTGFVKFRIFKDNSMHYIGEIYFRKCPQSKSENVKENVEDAKLDFIIINIIKLDKLDKDKLVENFTELEKWVYFFLFAGTDDEKLKQIMLANPCIAEANAEFLKFIGDEEYREMISRAEERERIENATIYYTREEGREEGIKERNIEIAMNMKTEGLNVGIIARLTGLSVDEIEKL